MVDGYWFRHMGSARTSFRSKTQHLVDCPRKPYSPHGLCAGYRNLLRRCDGYPKDTHFPILSVGVTLRPESLNLLLCSFFGFQLWRSRDIAILLSLATTRMREKMATKQRLGHTSITVYPNHMTLTTVRICRIARYRTVANECRFSPRARCRLAPLSY